MSKTIYSSSLDQILNPAPTAYSASEELKQRLAGLYALAQRSHYVFGSPLGPFFHRGHHLYLPRYVYFGPSTHDESLRLAFIGGLDQSDLRSSLAIVQFIEHLALTPDIGHSLNLSFYPVVDAAGLYHNAGNRSLSSENWVNSEAPEIKLLSKDSLVRTYHGFVRIESARGEDEISVSLRGAENASGVELVSSLDFDPLPVRWEAPAADALSSGPLSLTEDLPFTPFELVLRVPASWPSDLYRVAVSSFLKRFVLRYREVQAVSHDI